MGEDGVENRCTFENANCLLISQRGLTTQNISRHDDQKEMERTTWEPNWVGRQQRAHRVEEFHSETSLEDQLPVDRASQTTPNQNERNQRRDRLE